MNVGRCGLGEKNQVFHVASGIKPATHEVKVESIGEWPRKKRETNEMVWHDGVYEKV